MHKRLSRLPIFASQQAKKTERILKIPSFLTQPVLPKFKIFQKVSIEIPEDMLIHGNISPDYDGQICQILQIHDDLADVRLENNDTIELPLFFIKRIDSDTDSKGITPSSWIPPHMRDDVPIYHGEIKVL
jgi:hypothetical protein